MTSPTQNLIPFPKLQFFDDNGNPLEGGKVYTYAADGTTPKATYQDPMGATINPNPVPLDGGGRAIIWGSGQYVFQVNDINGNLVYTQATQDPIAELGITPFGLSLIQATDAPSARAVLGVAAAGAGLPAGVPLPYAGATAPSGWALCYGQAVSRATNPLLFAAIGTTWGAGDGSTTFNLPDLRGRGWFGVDAMGGSAANRITAASLGTGKSAVLGATGGSELLHGHSHTSTVTEPNGGQGHQHGENLFGNNVITAVTNGIYPTVTYQTGIPGGVQINSVFATSGITVGIGSTGSGTSQNLPPATIGNWIIQLV